MKKERMIRNDPLTIPLATCSRGDKMLAVAILARFLREAQT